MKSEERERSPLEGNALREIELSVRGKLRAHHLSEAFIERCGEEAIQRGVAEYLAAQSRGASIEHRDAFIVDVAFKRAMDELRREARHSNQAGFDMIVDSLAAASPATEEVAIETLQVEQMRQAIGTLRPEDRQVLSLFYFEERSAVEIAEFLHLSERSFRRRLRRATERLARKLGVGPLEPGSTLAIEVGFLSWVSLGGARVAVARGHFDQVVGAFEGVHQWAGRLFATGDGERFTVLISGPGGKLASACAGAAVVCVLGGVVGSGVNGITGQDPKAEHLHKSQTDQAATQKTLGLAPFFAHKPEQPPVHLPNASGSSQAHRETGSPARRRAQAREAEKSQVERQTSGIARATEESSTSRSEATESSSETVEPEAVVTPPPSSSSESGAEAAQAKQEFGAFK